MLRLFSRLKKSLTHIKTIDIFSGMLRELIATAHLPLPAVRS